MEQVKIAELVVSAMLSARFFAWFVLPRVLPHQRQYNDGACTKREKLAPLAPTDLRPRLGQKRFQR